MKYRKLRIAWSVVWGVVAVLLIVLWIRSALCEDHVFVPIGGPHYIVAASLYGHLGVGLSNTSPSDSLVWITNSVDEWPALPTIVYTDHSLMIAHWVPVLLSCFATACPWLPFRRF